MKYFLTYVKHSYEVIIDAEAKTKINLEHDVEAFMVHTFAKYMEQPNIPTDAIAIQMMQTLNENNDKRKTNFQKIAEECLLINGLKLNKRKWPSENYYKDMGMLAFGYRAYTDKPPELFYEKLATQFQIMSYLLNSIKL